MHRRIQFSYNWAGEDKLLGQFHLTKRERRCGQGVSTGSSSFFSNVGFSRSHPKTHKDEEVDFSARYFDHAFSGFGLSTRLMTVVKEIESRQKHILEPTNL